MRWWALVGLFALGLAAAAFAARGGSARATDGTLSAAVGPGFSISLTMGGSAVSTLAPGTYTVNVSDMSTLHNFHLSGPGVDQATDVATTSSATWTVTLSAGSYHFQCDAHPTMLHGDFTVGSGGGTTTAPMTTTAPATTTTGTTTGTTTTPATTDEPGIDRTGHDDHHGNDDDRANDLDDYRDSTGREADGAGDEGQGDAVAGLHHREGEPRRTGDRRSPRPARQAGGAPCGARARRGEAHAATGAQIERRPLRTASARHRARQHAGHDALRAHRLSARS